MNPESQPPSSFPGPPGAGIQAAATQWAARHRAGMTAAERSEFLQWLNADERHAAAFTRADVDRDELDWPWHSGTVDRVVAGLQQRARRRRVRRITTAVGALAALLVMGMIWQRPGAELDPSRTSFPSQLAVMQPDRQTLPDGTVIELKDRAEIAIDYSDAGFRYVTLVRGTAYFDVAHDALRPFIVRAAGVGVRAVGTAFAVELESGALNVVVTAGRIAVDQEPVPAAKPALSAGQSSGPPPPVFVDAGSSVVMSVAAAGVSRAMVRPMPQVELDERLAWRIPRLEFSGVPLAEVVAMINRHNRTQFVIADESISRLRLSGSLRADKMNALVQLLEADFPVRADQSNPAEIVLYGTM